MSHPRYRGPVIDAHCHIGHADARMATDALTGVGIAACVNLWNLEWPPPAFVSWRSGFPDGLSVEMSLGHAPDVSGVGRAGFSEAMRASICAAAADGAAVVKIWKNLGLEVRDPEGVLVAVDDVRLEGVWEAAAAAGIPIVIHVADPVAFFAPLDGSNERLSELRGHPEWWFGAEGMPSFSDLINQLDIVVGAHPKTIFIGAHMGCYAEDLDAVSDMLDRHANYFIDTSARIGEIGRQDPDHVREFFVRHADRVLFGSDFIRSRAWTRSEEARRIGVDQFFSRHWRYFETDADDLEHPSPIQGDWRVKGINLPGEVLDKLYFHNAVRVIRGLRAPPFSRGEVSDGA